MITSIQGLETCKLCLFAMLLFPKPLLYYAPENAYYAQDYASDV